MRRSLLIFAATLLGARAASNVLELKPDNFDKVIGKGKPALVEFFAPWCGHCKNLAPVYEELADAFSHAKDKVIIAKVDADGEGKPLGSKYGVSGFPTLKWFKEDGTHEPYDGGRDLDTLVAFVTSNSGAKSNIKPPPPPQTLILDAITFDDVVMNTSNNVLVAFTAPWCGHCKAMKPIYEKVAVDFKPESDCLVANVDADAAHNKELASRYGVKSFPTIKFFSKDHKEPEIYEGARTEEAFVHYLNQKCGTHRAVGGGLNDQAGRLEAFDALASQFFVASAEARDSIIKEASLLAKEVGETSQHYLRVMRKVLDNTEAYLEKESKRLATILEKRSLAPSKLDEIKIKANVIKAFLRQKAEEVQETTNIARATAEL